MKSGRAAWIGAVAGLALLLWLVGLPDRPSPALAASSASPFLPRPPFAPPRQIVLYAHVTSLVRRGGHWELRAREDATIRARAVSQETCRRTGLLNGRGVPAAASMPRCSGFAPLPFPSATNGQGEAG